MPNKLNKDYIRWHLEEATKEITTTLSEMESDSEWEVGDFSVEMRHLFHHVNSAWNARYSSEAEANECSDVDFETWRQYPTDLEII